MRKWIHRILKGASLTGALFVFQACYGTPPWPDYPVDPPDGQHYERNGKIYSHEGGYAWDYELVDNPPPPPRRWTRLDILTALGESDMFDAAFAYLNSIEVKPHISAWLGLNTANYIEEGYPNAEAWNALLDGAAQALGKTREDIDAFLANIPTE